MLAIQRRLLHLMLIAGLIGFTSCKTLLAPEYDKSIVEGVTKASEKTMTFLAKISEGTSKDNFSKREKEYNELIGAYDALKIRAKARPLPRNKIVKKVNNLLNTKGNNPLSGDYPSAFAFQKISETLNKMKDTDKKQGIRPLAMQAFVNQIETLLDQAITYESFLKR